MSKGALVVAGVLLAGGLIPREVAAEPVPAGPAAPGGGLTAEQMKAFADLTGDNPYRINGRLAAEPNLAPLAAKALFAFGF